MKVSLIEKLLDKIIYENNHQNADIEDLPFDGDEWLIARKLLYHINDNIIFSYIKVPSFCV